MRLLIVNYHYFRETKPDSGIHPLTLKEFEYQVDIISRYYEFITQTKLIEYIQKDFFPDKKYCLLTFDDGLKEQMEIFDLLIKKGVGGVFFATTDSIEVGKIVDIHKIHYIRSVLDDVKLYGLLDNKYNISKVEFDEDDVTDKYQYDELLSGKVKYFLTFILSKRQRREFVNKLFSGLVKDEREFAREFYMDTSDLIRIAQYNMLGTHSASHEPLAVLSLEEARNDIASSVRFLTEVTGSEIKAISYPYGDSPAVSQEIGDISRENGLVFGLTMFRDLNDIENLQNPLMLRRINTNEAPGGKRGSTKYCI